jgi:hypothetical protein
MLPGFLKPAKEPVLHPIDSSFLPRVFRTTSPNKCPKFKFHAILDKKTFVAGEVLYGQLQIKTKSHPSLWFREIAIELSGFERTARPFRKMLDSRPKNSHKR